MRSPLEERNVALSRLHAVRPVKPNNCHRPFSTLLILIAIELHRTRSTCSRAFVREIALLYEYRKAMHVSF